MYNGFMMKSTDRIELIHRVDRLRSDLEDFSDWLYDKAISGAVYALPVLREAETPTFIAPDPIEGSQAVQVACEALTCIDRLENQHPSTVMRTPGWLQLNVDPKPRIDDINNLKSSIKNTIHTSFKNKWARSKACQKLFPGVQMNQLYRHIHPVHPATDRISFHWQPRSTASRHLDVQQATELLVKTQKELKIGSHGAANNAIDIALERISSLADKGSVQLLCRTPIAPHPRAALFANGAGQALVTHHANLPLLLPPKYPDIQVRALPVFDAAIRGKPRGRPQRKLIPVCEIASLYAFNR
jgi:hypothetical protein